MKSQIPGSSSLEVSFSSWQYVAENDKKIQKLISRKVPLSEFLDVYFKNALLKFAIHVRVMIQQWFVFKITPISPLENDKIYLRTREDFQQDVQVLLREETVASHRGQGKISMSMYPVAVEVIDCNGVNLHALTFTGLHTEKSYSTVHRYTLEIIKYFEQMYDKKCSSYNRMTDGCGSQFWAYGSYWSACELKRTQNLKNVMFSRYAPSEGKNLSDAIGGIIKSVIK